MTGVLDPALRGVSKRKGPHSRRWVYKLVYARRCAELEAVRARPWPPSTQDNHDYGAAVRRYTEARADWRRIRGWTP